MVEVREWTRADTARLVRVPGPDDDKYSRGVVALRTGSSEYPGAAVLSVEAAWRAGAGYVRYIGTAGSAVIARRPETVVSATVGRTRVNAWVIGSGMDPGSRSSDDDRALQEILSGDAAVVVDAGALDLAPGATAPLVVTPHAGEFARLRARLGLPEQTAENRAANAAQTARALGHAVLLKGARTLIASADGDICAVTGTGWLSTAGSGDVLAGIIGALIAANPTAPLTEVAASGAWLHARAGQLAADAVDGRAGHPIVALDIAEATPAAIAELLS